MADEVIEAGLAAREDAVLVVQGDAQDLGDLLEQALLVGRELAPALAVDDLDDPHDGVLVHDGKGEHLGRPVARLLVPGLVEEERLVDLFELLLVVGIGDVDAAARVGHEARDAAVRDGQPDLLELGAREVERVELVAGLVGHVDRDQQGVEERKDAFLVLDEDVLDVLGGMDLVGDVEQFLALVELLGKGRYGGYIQPFHHLCRVHRRGPSLIVFLTESTIGSFVSYFIHEICQSFHWPPERPFRGGHPTRPPVKARVLQNILATVHPQRFDREMP